MMLHELLLKNRSYRRFHQDHPLDENLLKELVELTRRCPAACNRQPLKYLLSWQPRQNALIFPHLRWAAASGIGPAPARANGRAATSSSWATRESAANSIGIRPLPPTRSSWEQSSKGWEGA